MFKKNAKKIPAINGTIVEKNEIGKKVNSKYLVNNSNNIEVNPNIA